jgi:peptidoglycan/LPS O-acetylase OafA/YrhL
MIFSSIFLVHIFETGTILGAAWTLYHEMMFYTVFAFLIWRRKLGLTLLGIWFVCSIYALVFPPANGVAGVYLSPLHLLFGFGMIAMVVIRSGTVPAPHRFLWFGLTLFIATCIYESLVGAATPMAVIPYGFAATLCTLGLMELERSGRLLVSPVLIFLGDASYSIYLVHQPALSVLAKLIYPLSLRMRPPLIIPFLLLIVGSVSLGVLVHLLIERPLLKVVRRPHKLMDLSVAK